MTDDRKFDETISAWLEDAAPTGIPQRVLTATFDRTRRSRQQLGWRGVLGRLHMPRFVPALGGAAAVVLAAVLALSFTPLFGAGGPTPRPTAPPIEPEVTALLNRFLEARLAGGGAGNHINDPREDFPLLYATTSGDAYERGEFEPVTGYDWPYGFTAFRLRLFAGDTVVEQLVFSSPEGSAGLEYDPHGFGTDIAPTTENGLPLAVAYDYFDGEVTLDGAHPWIFHQGWAGGRLIPEGPGVAPTTDGGERNDWDALWLMSDPVPVGTRCQAGSRPADAEALAESIRSDPDLEATAPAAVSAGGAEAIAIDVVSGAGASVCDLDHMLPRGSETRAPLVLHDRRESLQLGLGTGDRMRLYLFDAPEGSSVRTLAIAVIAAESNFERAVAAAAPVVESVEFP